MNLAIGLLRKCIAEHEVQLELARSAAGGLKTQHDGAVQRANEYTAAIADMRSALVVLESTPPPAEMKPTLVVSKRAAQQDVLEAPAAVPAPVKAKNAK